MTVYYSPSKTGFFDDAVGYNSLPEDVIEVSPKLYQKMIEEVNINGKKIVVKNGKITFENNVPSLTWKDIRRKRNRLLAESDFTQTLDFPESERKAWSDYRLKLRDITDSFSAPHEVIWPKAPN